MLKGKSTITVQGKITRIVRNLWWEGGDLCVQFADGSIEQYTNAVMLDREAPNEEQLDIAFEPALRSKEVTDGVNHTA